MTRQLFPFRVFCLAKDRRSDGGKTTFFRAATLVEFGESLGLQDSILSEYNHCDQKSSGGDDDDDGQEKASCC